MGLSYISLQTLRGVSEAFVPLDTPRRRAYNRIVGNMGLVLEYNSPAVFGYTPMDWLLPPDAYKSNRRYR